MLTGMKSQYSFPLKSHNSLAPHHYSRADCTNDQLTKGKLKKKVIYNMEWSRRTMPDFFLTLYSTETNLTQLWSWDTSLYPARENHGLLDLRASDKCYFVLRRKIRQEKYRECSAHFDVILPWLIPHLEYNLCSTSTYTSIYLEIFSETIKNIMKAPEKHIDIALFNL